MLCGITLILIPDQVMLFFWKDIVAKYWLRTLGYFMFIEGIVSYKEASFYEIDGLFRWMVNYRLLQPAFSSPFLLLILLTQA